jgi:hypothetical protein
MAKQDSILARQVLYHLKYHATSFGLGYFSGRISIYAQLGMNRNTTIHASLWSLG